MRQILLYLFILFACGVNAEQFRITGTVVDEVHEPIIFAKVEVKDADRRTVTNVDGNFSIDVEKGAILKFSYIGYDSKEVEVLNDSSLFIELVPEGVDIENFVGCTHCFDPPIPNIDAFFKDVVPSRGIDQENVVANKYGFWRPILKPNSLDFPLPESELKKLPLYDESLCGEFIQLDERQIGRAKYLIYEEINKDVKNPLISMMRLGRYARQFLGVKHSGNTIVFINLVPSSLMPQFKDSISNSLITVDDGGDSFGYAIVDLTSDEVIMLRMNGD